MTNVPAPLGEWLVPVSLGCEIVTSKRARCLSGCHLLTPQEELSDSWLSATGSEQLAEPEVSPAAAGSTHHCAASQTPLQGGVSPAEDAASKAAHVAGDEYADGIQPANSGPWRGHVQRISWPGIQPSAVNEPARRRRGWRWEIARKESTRSG